MCADSVIMRRCARRRADRKKAAFPSIGRVVHEQERADKMQDTRNHSLKQLEASIF